MDKLAIYNIALGFVGTRTVKSGEVSPEMEQCDLHWDRARRSVLRDYPFDFSMRRYKLVARAGGVPGGYGGWQYCYAYPENALKVWSVEEAGGDATARQPYEIGYLDDATIICSNVADAYVTCAVDVTDLDLWSEKFVAALTRKLALLVGNALLKNNSQKIQELNALYDAVVPEKWRDEDWAVIGNTERLNIYNRALSMLGCKLVSSLTQNSPEAVQCNLHWDNARRAVLRDYPFDFAIRKSALVSTTMPTVTRGVWSKAYAVPAGSLRVLSVFNSDNQTTRQAFTVQYLPTGGAVILCDVEEAQSTYVVDCIDSSVWNDRFVTSLSVRLAMSICGALVQPEAASQQVQHLQQMYKESLPGDSYAEEGWIAGEGDATRLSVYNMALRLVGARMVSSIWEDMPETVQCGVYWDRSRRSVLRDFPYRFAVRRAILVSRAMPLAYGGDWIYCYNAPDDMLKALSVHNATDKQTRQAFSVEHLDDADVILCNVAGAQLTYTADIADVSRWDEKFTVAMAAKLAVYISAPLLAGSKDIAAAKFKELTELYNASIPQTLEWEPSGWSSGGDRERLNICNIALGYVGAKMITSTSENVPEAVQCNLHWDRARRSVLRDFPFRFSIRHKYLSATYKPRAYGGEWTKFYSMPDDALRILSINDGKNKDDMKPFAVEYNSTETLVMCNLERVQATYIADIEDTKQWDEAFVSAMSFRLAILISSALIENSDARKSKVSELVEMYNASLPGEKLKDEMWSAESDSTRLGIYNMALGFIGAKMVSSITEDISEAVQCKLYWDRARRAALRDFAYRFAQRRIKLEKIPVPMLYKKQFKYCYKRPDEALKVGKVHGGIDKVARFPFLIESLPEGEVILCNINNAQATCTIDVPDVSKWDDMFVDAMAHKLAIFIAPALVGDTKLSSLIAEYNDSISRTDGASANEGTEKNDADTWLLARCGASEDVHQPCSCTSGDDTDCEDDSEDGDEDEDEDPRECDDMRTLVEMLSGGRNTVRYNKDGVPSIFYRLPMFYLDDIVSSWPHEPHPAFIINDPESGQKMFVREILIGLYESSLWDGKYLVSLPGKVPFTYAPFDIHIAYSRANNMPGGISIEYTRADPNNYTVKSNGKLDTKSYWHAMTNAEYAAIALWCQKKGYEPRGNSWYGLNKFHSEEKGTLPTERYNYNTQSNEVEYTDMPGTPYVAIADDVNNVANCPVLTGTAPLAWRHDGSAFGIENLVGNTYCCVAGTRLVDGQIQSFVNNNAALPDADFCGRTPLSPDGSLDNGDWKRQTYYTEPWKGFKAFDKDGKFIRPPDGSGIPTQPGYPLAGGSQPQPSDVPRPVREEETLKYDGSYMGDGTPTPSGNFTYGCGVTRVSTKIDIPDSGGTDRSPMTRYSDTGEFFYDPSIYGIKNGSCRQWFSLVQIAGDNPADDIGSKTRSTDIQPNYMMRALGLFPVCAHSDLWDNHAAAAASERETIDPETGELKTISHDGYYYNNGYLNDEVKEWYGEQQGRMWTRNRGECYHIRGGTYYYESAASEEERPICSLWTQSFSTQRYDRLIENYTNATDLGVGWMSGSRICIIENPQPLPETKKG